MQILLTSVRARIQSLEEQECQENLYKNELAKKDDTIANIKLENKTLMEKSDEQEETIKELQNSINVKI